MPLKASAMWMGSSAPTAMVRAVGVLAVWGAVRALMVTLKDRAARPAALMAVTVTVVDATATPRRETAEPSTVTVSVSVSPDTAV